MTPEIGFPKISLISALNLVVLEIAPVLLSTVTIKSPLLTDNKDSNSAVLKFSLDTIADIK